MPVKRETTNLILYWRALRIETQWRKALKTPIGRLPNPKCLNRDLRIYIFLAQLPIHCTTQSLQICKLVLIKRRYKLKHDMENAARVHWCLCSAVARDYHPMIKLYLHFPFQDN